MNAEDYPEGGTSQRESFATGSRATDRCSRKHASQLGGWEDLSESAED